MKREVKQRKRERGRERRERERKRREKRRIRNERDDYTGAGSQESDYTMRNQ